MIGHDPPLADTSNPVADKDVAETFGESDVTLTHSKTAVSAESIGIDARVHIALASVASNTNSGNEMGVLINPNESISEIRGQLSANNVGTFDVFVRLNSDGSLLGSVTGKAPGDTFSITGLSLTAGTDYRVVATDPTTNFDVAKDTDETLPVTAASFDIINGYYQSGTIDQLFAFDYIAPGLSPDGTVTVEWPTPSDVFRWDAATFQRTTDGETVNVYVEESTDGGSTWTEVAGPISRGDEIPVDPEDRCRFRVELSRVNTANKPTCDALARRWVL